MYGHSVLILHVGEVSVRIGSIGWTSRDKELSGVSSVSSRGHLFGLHGLNRTEIQVSLCRMGLRNNNCEWLFDEILHSKRIILEVYSFRL